MPRRFRTETITFIGEFVGTFMFLFFAFSTTQVANFSSVAGSVTAAPNTANLLYVALGFGFSLAVNAWVFFRTMGGLFNPAISIWRNFSAPSHLPALFPRSSRAP